MKRMSKKQWYATLERYSELATQRKNVIEKYGIDYWDDEPELTQIQDSLLQQRFFFRTEFNTLERYCMLDDIESIVEHEIQTDIIFLLIENLEPLPDEIIRHSFIKTKIVCTDVIYALFALGIILLLHLMFKR